jgi:hypothetical protein
MGYDGWAVSDPHLDELWQAVLAKWDDDAAHAAFLDHARGTNQLGAAATRYREEVKRASAYREDALRVESAQKRLNGVAMLAMLELTANRTPREPPRLQIAVRWAAALGLFALAIFTIARFLLR